MTYTKKVRKIRRGTKDVSAIRMRKRNRKKESKGILVLCSWREENGKRTYS